MNYRVLAVLIMILLMVPVLTRSPQQYLVVRDENGARVWCSAVDTNDETQLQFTHSMYGGYVKETWRVTSTDQLNRERFVTENAAAAEYYATDGGSYEAEDGYVVPGEPLQQPELVIRVNDRGNHMLTVDGEVVHLAGILNESTQVRISVESESCGEANEAVSGKDD